MKNVIGNEGGEAITVVLLVVTTILWLATMVHTDNVRKDLGEGLRNSPEITETATRN